MTEAYSLRACSGITTKETAGDVFAPGGVMLADVLGLIQATALVGILPPVPRSC